MNEKSNGLRILLTGTLMKVSIITGSVSACLNHIKIGTGEFAERIMLVDGSEKRTSFGKAPFLLTSRGVLQPTKERKGVLWLRKRYGTGELNYRTA